MLDCATAAFMNRRSRIAEVSAAVPTAAHAAWRRNWRRVWRIETCLFSIKRSLFLDCKIRRTEQHVNHGPNPVTHLRVTGRRAVAKIAAVGHVIYNRRPGTRGQLACEQKRIERIH